MSVKVYFSLSSGLAKTIVVPRGTIQSCVDHVTRVEKALGFRRDPDSAVGLRWRSLVPAKHVSDQTYCETAERHNAWMRVLHKNLGQWSKTPPVGDVERMTPKDAQRFWYGLVEIQVPQCRWTASHYRARMDHVYAVMRGEESEGETFDANRLRPKQAAAVVCLFEAYLDKHDLRLDVPLGRDHLASHEDGGYEWCEKCGAIEPDDADRCTKRACPIRAERG